MSLFDLFRSLKSLLGFATGSSKLASKSGTACVVVGMERSKTYGECPGSDADAAAMSKALGRYGGVAAMTNRQATRAAVRKALQDAVKKDLAIFYYSGHGGQEHVSAGGGMTEFLCLDDGPFHDTEIWDAISKAKGRVVCIFDCCHSGNMYRVASVEPVRVQITNTGFSFRMLSETPMALSASSGILVWSGCPADSYSYGDPTGGVFTKGLLSGLGQFATYDSVWRKAKSAARAQKPVRTVIGSGFSGPVFR